MTPADYRRALALILHVQRQDGEGVSEVYSAAAVAGRLDALGAAVLTVAATMSDPDILAGLLYGYAAADGAPPRPPTPPDAS